MDLSVQMQIFKRLPLFKNIPEAVLKTIAENCDIINCQSEKEIFAEGKSENALFIVCTGNVTLFKKSSTGQNTAVFTLMPGDCFGDTVLFAESAVLPVTAKAAAQTILFRIPGSIFMVMLEQNSTLAYNLIHCMGTKINKIYRHLADLTVQQAELSPLDAVPITADHQQDYDQSQINAIKEALYEHKVICPLCEKKFTTPQVLSRRIRIEKTDSDFCNYYQGANPLFYEVAVCPECGFAFTADHAERLGAAAADAVEKVLADIPKKDYSGVRDWQLALETYILALKCLTAAAGKHSVIARLYLRAAWLYRYKQDSAGEKKYLQLALDHYQTAFSRETFDTKQELQLLYMIGELYNRLGNPDQAVQWFNRLVQHPGRQQMPAVVSKAREQWQNLRAALKSSQSSQ